VAGSLCFFRSGGDTNKRQGRRCHGQRWKTDTEKHAEIVVTLRASELKKVSAQGQRGEKDEGEDR